MTAENLLPFGTENGSGSPLPFPSSETVQFRGGSQIDAALPFGTVVVDTFERQSPLLLQGRPRHIISSLSLRYRKALGGAGFTLSGIDTGEFLTA